MAMSTVKHHGSWVRPGPGGCLCGMDWHGEVRGGDCRSLGCDPCCPACGDEDASECPDYAECGGTGKGLVGSSKSQQWGEREWSSYEMYGPTDGTW